MKELMFESNSIRVSSDEPGSPLFCGRDVAIALGYKRPAKAVMDNCKGVLKRDTLTPGGKQKLSFIPESDVYRLILRSNAPNAEKFQDWVCGEVLPSIRKTGQYRMPNHKVRSLARIAKEVEDSNELYKITDLAKASRMTAIALNEFLRVRKMIYKQGRDWYPMRKFHEKDYFRVVITSFRDQYGDPHPTHQLRVTGKGWVEIKKLINAERRYPSEKTPSTSSFVEVAGKLRLVI